jgi:hypothetical protein
MPWKVINPMDARTEFDFQPSGSRAWKKSVRHPPFAERRVPSYCVFEMTSGRGFAPNVRAANEWMCGTVTNAWMSGIPKDGCPESLDLPSSPRLAAPNPVKSGFREQRWRRMTANRCPFAAGASLVLTTRRSGR